MDDPRNLAVPTQDDRWCDWCGEASDTSICPACQRRYEEETARPFLETMQRRWALIAMDGREHA